jgi:DNA invertase Pin-like site-specific DNA recombinase
MAARTARPYAIYTRLSRRKPVNPNRRTRTRDDETVERQERDIRAYAVEHGLPLDDAHVYVDNHFSAWKRKAAKRPAFEAMMTAAKAGRLAGILIWKVDRFTRAPRDMEDLIELAEDHGVVIDGPASGRIDLTTASGRQQARGAAGQGAAESDNTSERSRRGLHAAAEDGVPMGPGRMFGYRGARDDDRCEVRADEAAVLREMAGRMIAGEPLSHLAADLNTRGVATVNGKPWSGTTLGRLLGQERYGGHIRVGDKLYENKMPGGAILDADTYNAVQALLASRRRGRRATERFALTGVAWCTRCDRTMNGATASKPRVDGTKRRMYRCPPQLGGCGMSVDADHLEDMVSKHMIRVLSDPKIAKAIAEKDASLGALRSKRAQAVENIEQQLEDLEVKKALGEIITRAYDKAKPILDKRLAQARADRDEVGSAEPLVVDATADWRDAEPAERRLLIRRYEVQVRIDPAGPRTYRWDASRVHIA